MPDGLRRFPAPFELRSIESAGRGLVTVSDIKNGQFLLSSQEPIVHVIFREYRKEVCGQCFHYDRGRMLDIRAHDIGKVFCSQRCCQEWLESVGEIGLQAWQNLETFVRSNAKNLQKANAMNHGQDDARPTIEQVRQQWTLVDGGSVTIKHGDSVTARNGEQQRRVVAQTSNFDPDVLGFLLCAVLARHRDPVAWQDDMMKLAMDESPYSTVAELEAHCQSFLQLGKIMPREISDSCSKEACQVAASAASHNAFGIRSGSDDNEEYMGYGVWPAASYFNHSCQPNVQKTRIQREWRFHAAEDVLPDEQLCISYLGGDEKMMTVEQRRARLQQTWGFLCCCARCMLEAQGD